MRVLLFTLCVSCAVSAGVTGRVAADDRQTTDEVIATFAAPPVAEETTYFSDRAINRLLSGSEQAFEDPNFTLVQREEPVSGETPEERVLRDRVLQVQQDYSGAPYSYR